MNSQQNTPWKKWGPYLTDRQWGTVREDYSESGDAWESDWSAEFTHQVKAATPIGQD